MEGHGPPGPPSFAGPAMNTMNFLFYKIRDFTRSCNGSRVIFLLKSLYFQITPPTYLDSPIVKFSIFSPSPTIWTPLFIRYCKVCIDVINFQISAYFRSWRNGCLLEGWALIRGCTYWIILYLVWAVFR